MKLTKTKIWKQTTKVNKNCIIQKKRINSFQFFFSYIITTSIIKKIMIIKLTTLIGIMSTTNDVKDNKDN